MTSPRATGTSTTRDRGAVDVSIEMLFGTVAVLMALLLVFETAAYWHARNVFDDAASDGARIAAAFDGSCADGVEVARAAIARHAGSWASEVEVSVVANIRIEGINTKTKRRPLSRNQTAATRSAIAPII